MAKGLLGKVENDNSKKHMPIKRAPNINYESLVKKEDIIVSDDSRKSKTNISLSQQIDTKKLFVNVRINQGIRNTLNGLSILGYGDTCLETINIILEDFLSNLSSYEIEKLEGLKDFYDKKDLINFEKKQTSKKNSI